MAPPEIDAAFAAWIAERPMWFVATAPLEADRRVNVPPCGHDSLAVLGPHYRGELNAASIGDLPGL